MFCDETLSEHSLFKYNFFSLVQLHKKRLFDVSSTVSLAAVRLAIDIDDGYLWIIRARINMVLEDIWNAEI